jgi:hypothetical protein
MTTEKLPCYHGVEKKLFISSSQWNATFPNNRSGSFSVKLPEKLKTERHLLYHVNEINLPKKFFNVREPEEISYWETKTETEAFKLAYAYLPAGYYEKFDDLVDAINEKVGEMITKYYIESNTIVPTRTPKIELDNKRAILTVGGNEIDDGPNSLNFIVLSKNLLKLLKIPGKCEVVEGIMKFCPENESSQDLSEYVPYDYQLVILKSSLSSGKLCKFPVPKENSIYLDVPNLPEFKVDPHIMTDVISFYFINERGERIDNHSGITYMKFTIKERFIPEDVI